MPRAKSAVVVPAPTVRRRGPGRPAGTLEQSVNEAIVNATVHHVVAVRRKRGGEITHVKHIKWGWMPIGDYYLLDEFHKLLPLVQEIIRAGYQIKSWLWNSSIELDVLATGFKVPYGLIETGLAFGLYEIDSVVLEGLEQVNAVYQTANASYQAQLSMYKAWKSSGLSLNEWERQYWAMPMPVVTFTETNPPQAPTQSAGTQTYQIYKLLDWLALALPFGEFYYLYRMSGILGIVAHDFMDIVDPGGGAFGLPQWIVDMVPGLALLAGQVNFATSLEGDAQKAWNYLTSL